MRRPKDHKISRYMKMDECKTTSYLDRPPNFSGPGLEREDRTRPKSQVLAARLSKLQHRSASINRCSPLYVSLYQ